MLGNSIIRLGKRLLVALLIVELVAAIPAPVEEDPYWPNRMDRYIKENLQDGMFHVCFQSIDNSFKQYYRNANLPISSIDVIKIPIVYEVLWQVKKKELDLDKTVEITANRIKQNKDGFFGPEDVGKEFTLERVVEASMAFNNNAAANILLETVGYQKIVDGLRDEDLSNTYIRRPLMDSLKNERAETTNFVTAGDMMHLMKRIRSEKKFKNKDWLMEQLKLNAQKNGAFGIKGGNVAGISENTKLSKGFIAMVEDSDQDSYYISMFVSNFKSESKGDKFLKDMIYIFNGGTIETDSVEVAKKVSVKDGGD
jgi:beta-lactamase class A